MKEKEITVLKVEPGKSPETVTMPNTLDAMQKMVGGYIEVLPWLAILDPVIFVLLPKSRYNTLVKCLLSRIPSNQVR